jgi:iron-desferrioxamine transport system substrate-binding protein
MFRETVNAEEAMKYPSDIFFNSTRAGSSTPKQLQASPLFGQHPAIKAGQIGAWNQDFILNYQGMKAALDTMMVTLSTAEKVTG